MQREETTQENVRILIVEDKPRISPYFTAVARAGDRSFDAERSNTAQPALRLDVQSFREPSPPAFEFLCCRREGNVATRIRQAAAEDSPFVAAFIDVRSRHDAIGLEVLRQVHSADPMINIILCNELSGEAPPSSPAPTMHRHNHIGFLYMDRQALNSPDTIRILVLGLEAKRKSESELSRTLADFQAQLDAISSELNSAERILQEEHELRLKIEEKLQIQSRDLKAASTALDVMTRNKEEQRKSIEERILDNVRDSVDPFLAKLKKEELNIRAKRLVAIIEDNLHEIVAPFIQNVGHLHHRLTPLELHICNLVKKGRKSKEIAQLMELSTRTVEHHRNRIRKKIGLNGGSNLRESLKHFEHC